MRQVNCVWTEFSDHYFTRVMCLIIKFEACKTYGLTMTLVYLQFNTKGMRLSYRIL